jgi:hypothetical protein
MEARLWLAIITTMIMTTYTYFPITLYFIGQIPSLIYVFLIFYLVVEGGFLIALAG